MLDMLPRLAIPSYQRSEYISGPNGTLTFLKKSGYPNHLIHIFVASEEEANLYKYLTEYKIIIGTVGLAKQRNFITDYFDDGETILSMDDDIKGVKIINGSFIDLITKGVQSNAPLWGILPNDDGRKMIADVTTTHLTHILGSLFLYKVNKNIRITINEKEDFERSILYFKQYGSVSRYKGAGTMTAYAQTAGGLQQEGRGLRMLEEIKYLHELYPEYIRKVQKKKGLDIVLNWRLRL